MTQVNRIRKPVDAEADLPSRAYELVMPEEFGHLRSRNYKHHDLVNAKVGKDSSVSLADKEAAVTSSLAQLPALLNAVRALIGKPAPPSGAKQPPDVGRSALRLRTALASLQPVAAPLRSPDHQITRSPDSSEVSHGQ